MPFKTPYGKHYHTIYGCHRATEACTTTGLAPCSDCYGRSKVSASDVSGGGTGAAGIAGVPQDAVTGEMIAFEFGQDYDSNAAEYDNAASFIQLMGSADDRARAARAVAVGMAERDFEQEVMRTADLIEGEVATQEHMEVIQSMVFLRADDAIRRAYRGNLAESLFAPNSDASGSIDRQKLAEAMASRLEESGCVPWLTPEMRETLSYSMVTDTLRTAFDDACDSLAFRRGVLPESMPVATMMMDMGQEAMANGQSAPEGKLSIVPDSGVQDFPHIRAVNGHLVPTDYGDGFDVGDVVTYDAGYSMILPHFAFVVRRTPKMIETIDLPTTDTSTDGYGQFGMKRPVDVVDLSGDWHRKRSKMRKSGSFSIDGHWARPWDGSSKHYDYMD